VNILWAIIAGLLGGTASAAVTFFVTIWIWQALHVSDREGGVGYLGMSLGLLLGVAGMTLSIIVTLRFRGQSALAIWAQTPLALIGIAALGAIGMALYYNAHDHPIVDGAPPVLEFQLQAPPNRNLPDPKNVQVKLQAGRSGADGWWDDDQTQQADGRPVLTGRMQLYLRTSDRLVVFQLPGDMSYLFKLRLPASPLGRKYQKWSAWQPSDFVFTPDSNVGRQVPAQDAYRIRYLVQTTER
jgi:hypothetical protein